MAAVTTRNGASKLTIVAGYDFKGLLSFQPLTAMLDIRGLPLPPLFLKIISKNWEMYLLWHMRQ